MIRRQDKNDPLHFVSNLFTGKKPRQILDVGASNGWNAYRLASHYPHASVVAIDINEEQLSNIENINQDYPAGNGWRSNLSWQVCDAMNASDAFQGQEFDLILLNMLINHLDDPKTAIQRLSTLLKPGGSMAISVPNYETLKLEGGSEALLQAGKFFGNGSMYFHKNHLIGEPLIEICKQSGLKISMNEKRRSYRNYNETGQFLGYLYYLFGDEYCTENPSSPWTEYFKQQQVSADVRKSYRDAIEASIDTGKVDNSVEWHYLIVKKPKTWNSLFKMS